MKFLRIKQVLERRGCSRAQLYREIADGTFPASIRLSPRMAVWTEASVDEWFRAKIAAHKADAPKDRPAKDGGSGVLNASAQ